MTEVQVPIKTLYGFVPKVASGEKEIGSGQAIDLLIKHLERNKFKLYRNKYQLLVSLMYYLDHLYSMGAKVVFCPEEIIIVIDNPKYEGFGLQLFTIRLFIKEYCY